MYFGIYGEDEIDNIKLKGKKSILIRICASSDLKTSYLYKNILYLNIDDIVNLNKVTKDFENRLLVQFLKLNKFLLVNDFDEVIVHCTLGISRSPAIMICIARILKSLELEKIIKKNFDCYNKIIIEMFEKMGYIKKNINIDNVEFIGHFIDKSEKGYEILNFDEDKKIYDLILKR